MKYGVRILYPAILLFFAVLSSVHASWAYPFVVHKGDIYRVTDEKIDRSLIKIQIGKVTSHSDREGTYRGNFSNAYPKGTPYYSIQDMDPQQAIAVKTKDELFLKAVYEGKYKGYGRSIQTYVVLGIIAAVVILSVFIVQRINLTRKI